MARLELTQDEKDQLHEIILERTELDPETGCMVFVGAWNANHYGVIVLNGKRILAHRAAAAIWKGFDPDGDMLVIHRCNVRSCCNPRHLQFGNRTQNVVFFQHANGPRLWARSLSRQQALEASGAW